MQLEVTRTVEAPADSVWEIVTDLERSADVIKAIEHIEILEGPGRIEVGTRWRETRTMFGKTATEEMEVTDVQPGRSYTVVADGHSVHYRSVIAVAPLAEARTSLSMTFAAAPRGLGSKLLAATVGRLFAGATRRALEKDFDDIATAAERGKRMQ